MVSDKWGEVRAKFNDQTYSLDRWHGCLQALRKYLKGWNIQLVGSQRANKISITKRIEEIDIIAESRLLDIKEWDERIELEVQLEELNNLEEIY